MAKTINNNYFIGLLFVLSFFLFGRTLNYEFVWDDQRSHLTQHKELMEGDLKAIWKKPYDGMYIPMTYTTWYLIKQTAYDERTSKLEPKAFHAINILTHSINCVLVFLILFLLFGNNVASFIGTLIFLLHPLQVETVAWVSEFRSLYSTFFSLLSLYLLLKLIKKNTIEGYKDFLVSKHFIGATLLFVLALLAKPSAITLPFVAAIIIWCFYPGSFKTAAKALSTWLLLLIPVVFITSRSQTNDVISFISPIWTRPFIAGDSIFFYFTKLIAPYDLAACYGRTPQMIIEGGSMYFTASLVLAVLIFLFIKKNEYRFLFTTYFMIIVILLPVTGLISFYYQRYSNVADRYMYFAMIGISILFAHFWQSSNEKKYIRYIILLFILVCTFFTYRQIPTWKNEFNIWDNSMQRYPNQWNAAYNRGVAYGKMNKLNEAIADYSIAISYNPADKNSVLNRANAYAQTNKFKEAIADYSRALELDKNDGSIYYNRALTFYYMGKLKSCVTDLNKAHELNFPIDPKFTEAVKQAILKQKESRKNS